MKKAFLCLLTVLLCLAFCCTALAGDDWEHPYGVVTSSASVTAIQPRMLNHVLQMNEAQDGWFSFTLSEHADVNLGVWVDPAASTGFFMELFVNDAPYYSWQLQPGYQETTLFDLPEGTQISWWDRDLNSWTTQTSGYRMRIAPIPLDAPAPVITETPVIVDASFFAGAPVVTEAPIVVVDAPVVIQAAPAAAPETIIHDTLAKGDHFLMGYYEQDNIPANGREPIEWTVLDVNYTEGTALVIATRALDTLRYHNADIARLKWGDCALRLWLNYMFFFDAFTPEERACVYVTYASYNADYVTLLDETQAKKYGLDTNGCDATAYAKARGADIATDNGKGCWWLRLNETSTSALAAFVGRHGRIFTNNAPTVSNNVILPVMTVSINGLMNCVRSSELASKPMPNYAVTNQKIATRSGPSQAYDEMHTFDVPVGTPVNVLRCETTNGTTWVEIEFLYQGEMLRVWTGLKRVDYARTAGLPGQYYAFAYGTLAFDVPGWYGPGEQYRVLYKSVPAGTAVSLVGFEDGWFLTEYKVDGDPLIHRAWMPGYAILQ